MERYTEEGRKEGVDHFTHSPNPKQPSMEWEALHLGEGEKLSPDPGLEAQYQAHHSETQCWGKSHDPYCQANSLNPATGTSLDQVADCNYHVSSKAGRKSGEEDSTCWVT